MILTKVHKSVKNGQLKKRPSYGRIEIELLQIVRTAQFGAVQLLFRFGAVFSMDT